MPVRFLARGAVRLCASASEILSGALDCGMLAVDGIGRSVSDRLVMNLGWTALLAKISAVGLLTALLTGSGPSVGETPTVASGIRPPPTPRLARVGIPAEIGLASYYGAKYHGRLTASGERFDMHALTAAHPRLPFGTRVKVIHLANGRSVTVRINDRGPFVRGRVIDLSLAAAEELGVAEAGVFQVRVETIP